MYTSWPAGAPGTGSRRILTFAASTSSIAQPVIARDPVTPAALSAGVSMTPVGAVLFCAGMTFSDTAIGAMTFDAPVAAMLILAEAVPPPGAAPGTSDTVSSPEPVPDAGETCSHALFEAAVQVTVPAPVCVSLSVSNAVRDTGTPAMMPKASDARSAASAGLVALPAVAVTGTDPSLRSPATCNSTTRRLYVAPAGAAARGPVRAFPAAPLHA